MINGTPNDDNLGSSPTIPGPLHIFGNAGDDVLTGSPFDDQIHGGGGNDILDGAAGNDQVFGDSGNDLIDGGTGLGNDYYDGGDGVDILALTGALCDYVSSLAPLRAVEEITAPTDTTPGTYRITDQRADAPEGSDTFTGIEKLRFEIGDLSAELWQAARGRHAAVDVGADHRQLRHSRVDARLRRLRVHVPEPAGGQQRHERERAELPVPRELPEVEVDCRHG